MSAFIRLIFICCLSSLFLDLGSGETYTSYQTSILCDSTYPIARPRHVKELKNMVRKAIKNGRKVKAFGRLQSGSDVICTGENGLPIDMSGVNHIKVNPDESVTAGGGATLKEILYELDRQNLGLEIIPAYSDVSIGGAIATGTHGSSLRHPALLSDYVKRILVIDGQGHFRNISDQKELQAFKLHLGLLGVVAEVTLSTIPQYKVKVVNYPVDDEVLFDGTVVRLARKHELFQLWWFPSSQRVILSAGKRVSSSVPGNAWSNLYSEVSKKDAALFGQALEIAQENNLIEVMEAMQKFTEDSLYKERSIHGKNPVFMDVTNKTLANPSVGYSHRLLTSSCKDCLWSEGTDFHPHNSEVVIPVSEFMTAMESIKYILDVIPVRFPFLGIYIKFAPNSTAYLSRNNDEQGNAYIGWSSAKRKNSFSDSKAGLAALQAMSQTLIMKHKGVSQWGSQGLFYHSWEQINLCQTCRSEFISIMQKYDPNGVFLNDFGERLLGRKNRFTTNPRMVHCALEENCVCSKNLDCGKNEFCSNFIIPRDFQLKRDIKICRSSKKKSLKKSPLSKRLSNYVNYYKNLNDMTGLMEFVVKNKNSFGKI